MKKAFSILILVSYLQLIVVPVVVSADAKDTEMKVIEIKKNKIVADKGHCQGIIENSVFGIKRMLGDELKYIGMAVVSDVSDSSCCLNAYPLSFIKIYKNDLLVLNERDTRALKQKQAQDYWTSLSQKNPVGSENDSVHDGAILVNPKIKLTSEKLLSEKRFIIKRDEEVLYKSFGEYKSVRLSDIESINVATKNYSLFGLLLGAAVGAAAANLQKGSTSIDTTYSNVGLVNDNRQYIDYLKKMRVTKKDNRMKKNYKNGIIVSSCLMGALLGSFFKGGWKELYSSGDNVKKTSVSISSPEVKQGEVNITLQIRR